MESACAGGATWRELRRDAVARLAAAGIDTATTEARFLVGTASGYESHEWVIAAGVVAPDRARTRLEQMLVRRAAGEPLQYVLGHWSFRGLDLFVDRRVLIPRPETEVVVEVALEEAQRCGLRRAKRTASLAEPVARAVIADIGTGSGAIAIALAAELPEVEVWATDVTTGAVEVARANVAGAAVAGVRVPDPGAWFDPLPTALAGRLQLVVSNPPYVASREVATLPPEVADYEPHTALVAGERGTEALEHLLDASRGWLAPDATVVLELAPHQAGAMSQHARALGYREVIVRDDLAGRPRVLVARTG